MNRSTVCFVSFVALVPAAVVTACEDDPSLGAMSFALPDSGNVSLDATTTPTVGDAATEDAETGAPDASDVDASDAGDAGDAGDASVANEPGILGSASAPYYPDRCPAGQLMIGVSGGTINGTFYDGVFSQSTTLCGTPTLPQGASTAVTITAGATVPAAGARGGVSATATAQAKCPANQVVVGLAGSAISKSFPPPRDLVASVILRCAPVTYAAGAYTVGAAANGAALGSGGTAEGPFDCGPGTVAVGAVVYAGDVVNGLGVHCDAPGH